MNHTHLKEADVRLAAAPRKSTSPSHIDHEDDHGHALNSRDVNSAALDLRPFGSRQSYFRKR